MAFAQHRKMSPTQGVRFQEVKPEKKIFSTAHRTIPEKLWKTTPSRAHGQDKAKSIAYLRDVGLNPMAR